MYNGVRIYGGQTNSYVRAVLGLNNDPQQSRETINDYDINVLKPSWGVDTIMQAAYNTDPPTLSASSYSISDMGIVGYRVFRRDGESLKYITDTSTEEKSIFDYNTKSLHEHIYYIFPKANIDGNIVLCSPIISEGITPYWDHWSVIGLIPDGQNKYVVDSSNIWLLSCNADGGNISETTKKTYHDTYGRFPRQSIGKRRYKEGDVSAYLGRVDYTGDYIDNQEMMDDWEKFANANTLKLLKSPKGMVIPITIRETSFDVDYELEGYPCKVEFSYTQMADASDISVYMLKGADVGEVS